MWGCDPRLPRWPAMSSFRTYSCSPTTGTYRCRERSSTERVDGASLDVARAPQPRGPGNAFRRRYAIGGSHARYRRPDRPLQPAFSTFRESSVAHRHCEILWR